MRVLTTQYCTIDVDPVLKITRYTRSSLAYQSIEDIEKEANDIRQALSAGGVGRRMLVDLRAISARNDPAFETAIVKLRKALYADATASATLVRTAVGALQVRRHAHEDHVDSEVFDSENLALEYLQSRGDRASVPPPSRRSHSDIKV